ncbi:AEC family transporter [Jeotgalibacillus sp. R-1-5s-1]|uniref:AEC family transporter n=1 Tax=Jeotgalibacillus sp. R-1-5s-1 TaxID=2555897 RepID=UPI00106D58D6|nr:AEC family transporter [Jeotgalibacillus sp. R-1-5s-1]TFD98398.1 auxin efflux carrier [Jeotgalibacillus sp. R-1-5s-1]
MDIQTVLSTIIVMGLMIATGSIFAMKVNVTSEVKSVLILLILNIAVPAVILNGVFSVDLTGGALSEAGIIFGISIVYHLAALVLVGAAAYLLRLRSVFAKKMMILGALGNTGFIGIPLAAAIFGPAGGFLAAIFDAGLSLTVYTIVIYLLQAEGKFHIRQLKAVINMPVGAIVIGILAAVSGFQPPGMMIQFVEMLAALAAPMAMLYVGMLLPPLLKKKREIFFPELWFPLSFRLMVIPLLMMLILQLFSFTGWTAQLIVIQTAMPTAMITAVLFSKFTSEEETAVVTIFASTLLSLITIPFIAWLMI